eukprot:TRINITY_DN10445_c0_g1_i3.p1 TRINITY_DN10445_c0_g1~~TRINITY_DN10445_c0_g1_i3.p1  ORF type:complete len:393 (-),score=21.55 TRINITY_DN10445_c0_g1_i3:58-1236(-)
MVVYKSEILQGERGPIFRVVPEDAPELACTGSSASGAWLGIITQVNERKQYRRTMTVSGPEAYGLSLKKVKKLIEALPNARRCKGYVFGHVNRSARDVAVSMRTAKAKDDNNALNQSKQRWNLEAKCKPVELPSAKRKIADDSAKLMARRSRQRCEVDDTSAVIQRIAAAEACLVDPTSTTFMDLPDDVILYLASVNGPFLAAKLMTVSLAWHILIRGASDLWQRWSAQLLSNVHHTPAIAWYDFFSKNIARARTRRPPSFQLSLASSTPPVRSRRRNANYLGRGMWLVDDLVAVRASERVPGTLEYLVKWRGYDEQSNSWQLETDIGQELVVRFHSRTTDAAATNVRPKTLSSCKSAFADTEVGCASESTLFALSLPNLDDVDISLPETGT